MKYAAAFGAGLTIGLYGAAWALDRLFPSTVIRYPNPIRVSEGPATTRYLTSASNHNDPTWTSGDGHVRYPWAYTDHPST